MAPMIPSARPQAKRGDIDQWIASMLTEPIQRSVYVAGRRGYFGDSMGVKGKNDRGIYDDGIFICTPDGRSLPFTANTDPSIAKPGVAVLEPGVWWMKPGTHNRSKAKEKQYEAFIQDSEFIVRRDGTEHYQAGVQHPVFGRCLGNARWAGWFGINLHRGALTTTSSAGCQTIYPTQWIELHRELHAALAAAKQERFAYILTARPDTL